MQRLRGQLGGRNHCSGSINAPPLGCRLWPSALLETCQHHQAMLLRRHQHNNMLLSPFSTGKEARQHEAGLCISA